MTGGKKRDTAASVRQRLLDLSRTRPELGEFGVVLSRYAIERVLLRLSLSSHRERFVLKGAQLFTLWLPVPHRPTRDVDLLGRGDNTPGALLTAFREITSIPADDDGLVFLSDSFRSEPIQGGHEHVGVRVRLVAVLAKARIPVQIDIGFGDAVTPPPRPADFPSLLGQAQPRMLVYARETVIAEKLEAMVSLSAGNTRMKDFFDVAALAAVFDFEGGLLVDAVGETFARRGTTVSPQPLALTPAFAAIEGKEAQWRSFLSKARVRPEATLEETVRMIADFLTPVLGAIHAATPFTKKWKPGGPWE